MSTVLRVTMIWFRCTALTKITSHATGCKISITCIKQQVPRGAEYATLSVRLRDVGEAEVVKIVLSDHKT